MEFFGGKKFGQASKERLIHRGSEHRMTLENLLILRHSTMMQFFIKILATLLCQMLLFFAFEYKEKRLKNLSKMNFSSI